MSINDDVFFQLTNQVGRIILNRPHALNALTFQMIISIQEQLSKWANDTNVKIVLVTSSSPKAFCAGGDIRWLYESGQGTHHEQLRFFWHEYQLNHYIHHYPKPYVSLINGLTMGGGVGISLHGAFRVGTDATHFAMPETAIGFFPDIGASFWLSKMPYHFGFYLGLTGNRMDAKTAHFFEWLNYQIAVDKYHDCLNAILSGQFDKDPWMALSGILNDFQTLTLPVGALSYPFDAIDQIFGQDDMVSIMDELADSTHPFLMDAYQQLQTKSPFSLAITFKQLKEAHQLSLAECLRLDYVLVNHFMEHADFYEGVRAMVIDKDKKPLWQDDSLSEVSSSHVNQFFLKEKTERLTFLFG